MVKSTRKKTKATASGKKIEKAKKDKMTNIFDNVNHLLELHKLQGALLNQLRKGLGQKS